MIQLNLHSILAVLAILLAGMALLDLVRAATALSLAVMCLAACLLVANGGVRAHRL